MNKLLHKIWYKAIKLPSQATCCLPLSCPPPHQALSDEVLKAAGPKDLQQLKSFFAAADSSQDGSLSRKELGNLLDCPTDNETFDLYFQVYIDVIPTLCPSQRSLFACSYIFLTYLC
jgi:hypothetical protein